MKMMERKMAKSKPNRSVRLPPPLPIWRCKASWANTAVVLLIPAKDAAEAKDKAWNRVVRTEGGESALKITILGQQS